MGFPYKLYTPFNSLLVGDNVDHNLQTIHGQGTFHGMGIIAVSVPIQGKIALHECCVNRILTKLPVSSIESDRGISILPYGKPGRVDTD